MAIKDAERAPALGFVNFLLPRKKGSAKKLAYTPCASDDAEMTLLHAWFTEDPSKTEERIEIFKQQLVITFVDTSTDAETPSFGFMEQPAKGKK